MYIRWKIALKFYPDIPVDSCAILLEETCVTLILMKDKEEKTQLEGSLNFVLNFIISFIMNLRYL